MEQLQERTDREDPVSVAPYLCRWVRDGTGQQWPPQPPVVTVRRAAEADIVLDGRTPLRAVSRR